MNMNVVADTFVHPNIPGLFYNTYTDLLFHVTIQRYLAP